MPRYTTARPKAMYWSDDLECEIVEPSNLVAIAHDEAPEPTGIVNKRGNEIYRVPDEKRFGFQVKRSK